MSYKEDTNQEFGVEHIWQNVQIKDSILTTCGTKVEIIERPKWGLACYMDNSIQSALIDEKIYHEALVHPVMRSVKQRKRVMIIGGGEGATAREVLKWSDVKEVDMYEWDRDVVELFRNKYPEWAKGVWNDPRLIINYSNIFEIIKTPPKKSQKYDVIIIDLFEPCEENKEQWKILIKSLYNWINMNGSIVMYAGMRNITENIQPYQKLIEMIEFNEVRPGHLIRDNNLDKDIIPYRVWIPSFSGESMFLLLKNPYIVDSINFEETNNIESHLTNSIWNSYKTLNW
jgi:spermidine synthase